MSHLVACCPHCAEKHLGAGSGPRWTRLASPAGAETTGSPRAQRRECRPRGAAHREAPGERGCPSAGPATDSLPRQPRIVPRSLQRVAYTRCQVQNEFKDTTAHAEACPGSADLLPGSGQLRTEQTELLTGHRLHLQQGGNRWSETWVKKYRKKGNEVQFADKRKVTEWQSLRLCLTPKEVPKRCLGCSNFYKSNTFILK